mgnify:CR=1 FL=1
MANGSEALLHLDGVTKVFVTDEVETHALESVYMDIYKGEYVAISGPSGCGKTTTLRAISGTVRRTGDVLFAGKRLPRRPET